MKFICEVGCDKFYMRNDVQGDRVTVNVTDLKSLWQVSMKESEIVDRFKDLNPLVQAKPDWIVTYVRSGLDPEKSTFGLCLEDTRLTINMHSRSDVKARMSLVLDRQDSQHFFQLVTNPMVAVINQLMEQRAKLLQLVKSKDLELREYKLEGAEISRKNVETDEIIEEEFFSETTDEFTSRIRHEQRVPGLNLSADLNEVFSETAKLKEASVCKIEDSSGSSIFANEGSPSSTKAEKRRLGNQTIVQVPRAKERKKIFKL